MTTSASSLPNLVVFPEGCQLSGLSNWAVFCDNLQSVARSAGLNGYLEGTITAPAVLAPGAPVHAPTAVNSHNPSLEEWELRDGRLTGIIFLNIKDPHSVGVTQNMSAHQMWTTLSSEYNTTSAPTQTLAKECIQQMTYTSGMPF
jgi:hypothetical protein